MDIFDLVDGLHRVVESLREQYGDFTLAMLYNQGGIGAPSGWNLIVAAPWTDATGRSDAITVVVQALHTGLSKENQAVISRVTVLRTSDPFVRDMAFLYPVADPKGPGVPVPQVTVGHVTEGSGYIFYSRRPVATPT